MARLASVIRRRYSRPVLWGACALLIVANVINIGADLGGMGEVSEMMTGVKAFLCDSGVPDLLLASGCSITDTLTNYANAAWNHGQSTEV